MLWLIGFFFQAVGDYQLFIFKKDISNKGRIMRYGVWRYTRHPNYFGESAMWWGIFLISCVSAHSIIGILLRTVGPAMITFMLLRVSGVTMLEGKYKGNTEYEEYQKNTSSFIPMLSKKK
jgi:steroid 5-alpha reductase family enzyme